jgi:hypothetical protein
VDLPSSKFLTTRLLKKAHGSASRQKRAGCPYAVHWHHSQGDFLSALFDLRAIT